MSKAKSRSDIASELVNIIPVLSDFEVKPYLNSFWNDMLLLIFSIVPDGSNFAIFSLIFLLTENFTRYFYFSYTYFHFVKSLYLLLFFVLYGQMQVIFLAWVTLRFDWLQVHPLVRTNHFYERAKRKTNGSGLNHSLRLGHWALLTKKKKKAE